MLNGHNPMAKGATMLQPNQSSFPTAAPQQSPSLTGNKLVGSTWTNSGGLDINIDNLSISGRGSLGNAGSTPMNQMVAGAPNNSRANQLPPATAFPVAAVGSGSYPGAPVMGYVQGIPIGVQQPLPQQQQVLGVGPAFFPTFK